MLDEAMRVLARAQIQPDRQLKCQRHADGHAFAMDQTVAKSGCRLERMAEGMTQIEQGALSAFTLVPCDDLSLHAAGMGHSRNDGLLYAGQGVFGIELQPFE